MLCRRRAESADRDCVIRLFVGLRKLNSKNMAVAVDAREKSFQDYRVKLLEYKEVESRLKESKSPFSFFACHLGAFGYEFTTMYCTNFQ